MPIKKIYSILQKIRSRSVIFFNLRNEGFVGLRRFSGLKILSIFKKFPKFRFLKRKFILLDKRQKFTISTLFLTSLLIITQIIWEDFRFPMVILLSVASYLLAWWSLSEDIFGLEWVMLFILPVFFVAFVSLFYFLLPPRMISRIIIGVIFSVGLYAILLVENIYNVAAIRTIQLLRAAQSIGLLLSLIVIFLYSSIIYSLRMPFVLNIFCISPVVFLMSLQSLWSVMLEENIGKRIYIYSLLTSLMIGETVAVFSFWPVSISSFALLISVTYYSLTGVFQLKIQDKLFKNTINEYLFVYLFTNILIIITTGWG